MSSAAAAAAFERRMTQTCRIEAAEGHTVLDPATLTRITDRELLYTGKCSLGTRRTGQGRDRGYGDFVESIEVLRLPRGETVQIPASSLVTITSGPGEGEVYKVGAEDIRHVRITRTFELTRLTALNNRSVPA